MIITSWTIWFYVLGLGITSFIAVAMLLGVLTNIPGIGVFLSADDGDRLLAREKSRALDTILAPVRFALAFSVFLVPLFLIGALFLSGYPYHAVTDAGDLAGAGDDLKYAYAGDSLIGLPTVFSAIGVADDLPEGMPDFDTLTDGDVIINNQTDEILFTVQVIYATSAAAVITEEDEDRREIAPASIGVVNEGEDSYWGCADIPPDSMMIDGAGRRSVLWVTELPDYFCPAE